MIRSLRLLLLCTDTVDRYQKIDQIIRQKQLESPIFLNRLIQLNQRKRQNVTMSVLSNDLLQNIKVYSKNKESINWLNTIEKNELDQDRSRLLTTIVSVNKTDEHKNENESRSYKKNVKENKHAKKRESKRTISMKRKIHKIKNHRRPRFYEKIEGCCCLII